MASYREHIVLADAHVQVVFAPVPHEVPHHDWQEGIVALFTWQQGRWQRFTAVSAVALRRLNAQASPYYAIAADFGREAAGVAYLTMIYADREAGSNKTPLTWRLSPDTHQLSLALPPLGASAAMGGRTKEVWQLRLDQVQGEVQPVANLAELGTANLAHYDYLTIKRPSGDFAVVGYQDFGLQRDGNRAWRLTHAPGHVLGLSGFALYFGQDMQPAAHQVHQALTTCRKRYSALLPHDYAGDESFALVVRCQHTVEAAGALEKAPVAAASAEAGLKRARQLP